MNVVVPAAGDMALVKEARAAASTMITDWRRQKELAGTALSEEDVRAFGESAITQAISDVSRRRLANGHEALERREEADIKAQVRAAMFGLGGLEPLLENPEVENIEANGPHHVLLTLRGGRKVLGPPIAESDQELVELIARLARSAGNTERRFDEAQPFLDLQLPDGSRLHAIMGVTRHPTLSIRKHRHLKVTLDDLVRLRTLSPQLAHTLGAAIAGPDPCSILVAGGTNTGKTTFARGLISQIPTDERIVVIEDSSELALSADEARRPYVVEMEVREPNLEGVGGIGMQVLGRQALRMNPDRLIVGETRSGYAVRAMLEAMNSGHEGSLTTIHAASSAAALTKMQTLALTGEEPLDMEASANLIGLVLDFVMHLAILPDGTRVVTSLREVTGVGDSGRTIQSNEIFKLQPGQSYAMPTGVGITPLRQDRLERSGYDRQVLQPPQRPAATVVVGRA